MKANHIVPCSGVEILLPFAISLKAIMMGVPKNNGMALPTLQNLLGKPLNFRLIKPFEHHPKGVSETGSAPTALGKSGFKKERDDSP